VVAGKRLSVSVLPHFLKRVRETASQVGLTKLERKENVRDAFGAAHPCVSNTLYILVDDVVTTGATMQAAIDALLEAGAAHVLPIALAFQENGRIERAPKQA
jgi:predicted amidophosphoribosyltransferase